MLRGCEREDVLEPAVRYERDRPGELIHIDVKKLGRITGGAGKRATGKGGRNKRRSMTDAAGVRRNTRGWEAVHIAIDDATRLAYVEVLPDEKAITAVGSFAALLTILPATESPLRA
jgi:hypothetical protein